MQEATFWANTPPFYVNIKLSHLQAERKKEKAEAARQANIERIFAEGEGAGDDME